MIDALKNNPADQIDGSTLYFMRVDDKGNFTDAGKPYCTTCSRFTMQAGVAEFALWNSDGADMYTLKEYNEASYQFHQKSEIDKENAQEIPSKMGWMPAHQEEVKSEANEARTHR